MTRNNTPWEEDSIKVNDADGNLAFEVIDLVKPDKLVPTFVKGAEYSDWRKELEENWTNITTGNKVGQTFRHVSGTVFNTGGAIGGVETVPTTTTVYGDTVAAPDVTKYAIQGYAIPFPDFVRKQKKEPVNPKLDASEKVAKKANADELMKARVEEFYDKVTHIQLRNDQVREDNLNKIKDHVKSLKLNISYDELVKKGAIKIKGGAIGIEDDGEGNIKIGVFKGPDVYTKGRNIHYDGDDYTSEVEDFNTEEGVKEIPTMSDELQKWQDGQNSPFNIKTSQELTNLINNVIPNKTPLVKGDSMSHLNPLLPRSIRAPGKMFIGYLTGQIKGNAAQVLDAKDIKSSWQNLYIDQSSNSLSVGGYMENVFGGESLSQLQKQGNNAVLKFNFAPHINEKEFAQHPGKYSSYEKAIMKILGPYTADLQFSVGPSVPVLGINAGTVGGLFAAWATALAKGLNLISQGRIKTAQNLSGSITISMDELKTVNPDAYEYLKNKSTPKKSTSKKTSKRSSLSLDEPIVRGKSKTKKSNWRSELNVN